MKAVSFDPVWNKIYDDGHQNRAPWDYIVTFLFRYRPRDKQRHETNILEVGCGTGNNLWFAASEGFNVAGVDGSETAIKVAKERFAHDKLSGDLRVGDFTKLPFEDKCFDMAFDRAALTCAGIESQKKAINEIHRVLKTGGYFLYNPYADTHSSRTHSKMGEDGVSTDIIEGTLVGAGQIKFVSRQEIHEFLPESSWDIVSLVYQTAADLVGIAGNLHSNWQVIARKK